MEKRKILVASIHPEEWNQYIPFNGYISTIKRDYDHVVGVVAYNPLILLSEADEYYTVENGSSGFAYPALLNTSARENHGFIDKCISQIKKDFQSDELHFVSWQDTHETKGVVNIHGNAAVVYRKSFSCAQDWYKSGKLIRPTLSSYNSISSKFGHLIAEDTFIVLTREYSNKAPIHNTKTSIPNFELMIKFLVENGIKILNIGFPPATCSITSENYAEFNQPLTQDELVSLFYLSKGVLMQADAGGFVGHFASNCDFFILTDQWSLDGEFSNFDILPHKTKEVDTISLKEHLKLLTTPNNPDNFQAILDTLKNYNPKKVKTFQEEKKITFVK